MKHKSYHLFPSCCKGQHHHTYIKYSCQQFYSHLLAPACLIHTWLPPISLFQKQFFLFWSFQIKVSSSRSENSFIHDPVIWHFVKIILSLLFKVQIPPLVIDYPFCVTSLTTKPNLRHDLDSLKFWVFLDDVAHSFSSLQQNSVIASFYRSTTILPSSGVSSFGTKNSTKHLTL